MEILNIKQNGNIATVSESAIKNYLGAEYDNFLLNYKNVTRFYNSMLVILCYDLKKLVENYKLDTFTSTHKNTED